MKRRDFVKSLSGVAGSAVLGSTAIAGNDSFKKECNGLKLKPNDDNYWVQLKKKFSLPLDYSYFNTGGLGASPKVVTEKVIAMMETENTHPAPGYRTDDWSRIKSKCAVLLGAGVKKEEVALVSCATEGINIILNGLPLKNGDEVIVSTHEHAALSIPLVYKMKQTGIIIRFFDPLSQGGIVTRIKTLINKQTRLIFISHITCTTGLQMPVKEIAGLAKTNGIWFALDGAQALGHISMDLKDMGVDFYAASGHKWLLGPNRTGILYVREELTDLLAPTCVGAYSDGKFDFEKKELQLHPSAQRYEYGTQNESLFMGLETAIDFINQMGMQTIRQHGSALAQRFRRGLEKLKLTIISPMEPAAQSSVVTFKIPDRKNGEICIGLEKQNYRVRYVPEANLNAIRVSFHIYNSEKEVDGLLQALEQFLN